MVLFWLPPPSLLSVAPFVIDGSVGALDPRESSLQQRVLLLCEAWSERFSVPAARRCSPRPLCDSLSCVRLRNEGLYRGLLSRRGPVVLPTLLGTSILVSLSVFLAKTENLCVSCHCHTLLPFTCVHDFLSVWASSHASQCPSHCGQMRLCILFIDLHCTRVAIPTLLICASSPFC